MHICLITPSFPPMVDGGVAVATGRLVTRLAERGHRITVLTAPPAEQVSSGSHGATANGFALYYRFVEEPLRVPQALTEWLDWIKVKHQQQAFDVILGYFVYPGVSRNSTRGAVGTPGCV